MDGTKRKGKETDKGRQDSEEKETDQIIKMVHQPLMNLTTILYLPLRHSSTTRPVLSPSSLFRSH